MPLPTGIVMGRNSKVISVIQFELTFSSWLTHCALIPCISRELHCRRTAFIHSCYSLHFDSSAFLEKE